MSATNEDRMVLVGPHWNTVVHGELQRAVRGSDQVYYTTFAFRHYRVMVSLLVGPRGGMKERTIVLDPTWTNSWEQTIADYTGRDGLLSISGIRFWIKKGLSLPDSCRKFFSLLAQKAENGSPYMLEDISRMSMCGVKPIRPLQGGAPGLGRRH